MPTRAAVEKGEIEAVQVVILDDVRIGRLHHLRKTPNELGLRGGRVVARLEHLRRARRFAHGDHEDAVASRIESCGLEIELHAAQRSEWQISEVRASRRDEVLLLGREGENMLMSERVQMRDA